MRTKPALSKEQLTTLNKAKTNAKSADIQLNISDFPGVTSNMLSDWLYSQSDLYTPGYTAQVGKDVPAPIGPGTVYASEDVYVEPVMHQGYKAFAELYDKIVQVEKALEKDNNKITTKLAAAQYSELIGVADIALKQACDIGMPQHVSGLLKAGAWPSAKAIAEIARNPLLKKETVEALILGGVDSKIILENLNPNNQERDMIVNMVAIDQAILQGFQTIEYKLFALEDNLKLGDMTDAQIVDLIRSVVATQANVNTMITPQQDNFLKEFQQACYINGFQEFVADVIGIFSDKGRDDYRASIIREQLQQVFETTIKQELAESKSSGQIKPGGFVEKLQAENKAQNQGQER